MESDLLVKESEFYKENERIEAETKQLLQKVNDVMKIQDSLIKDSLKTQAEINTVKKTTYKLNKTKIPEDDINVFEKEFNVESIDGSSNEPNGYSGLCRVYRTKLKSLIAEKERIQGELRQKCDEMKKHQKENQLLKEEKEKWFLAYNSAKTTAGKLESQIANLTAKIQTRDAELGSFRKELDQLKKELKSSTVNCNNAEVRLTRINEDNDKLRAALKVVKDEDKDLKENHRKQVQELTSAMKKVERQKFELLNGFKKQIHLIDVLKKEKMHLEAVKVSEMAETTYLKILDWKFD